jgi:Xaa-Pro dipeptidase
MLFAPKDDIDHRINGFKALLEKASLDGAFIHYKIDFYYLSGTMQDVFLFVPVDGEPILFVKRELRMARRDSPLEHIVPFKTMDEVKPFLPKMKRVGFQLDVVPYNQVLKFKEAVGDLELVDVSPLVKALRTYKSAFEIKLMERAAAISKKVYEAIPHLLKEGMREIELGGLLEGLAKSLGHEGLLRVRSLNYEAYSWHILSGRTGSVVSQSDSPMGGLGLSPAFPVGASMKKMKKGEPILVDFGICYQGYQADQTRMYAIGHMPEEFARAYEVCREIQYRVLDKAVKGAISSELFQYGVQLAKDAGYGDFYLGYGHHKVSFLGHGIGLELAEFPYITARHDYPIEEGAVFAIEPKMVFPRQGACGVENTVIMEKGRYRILTEMDEAIVVV